MTMFKVICFDVQQDEHYEVKVEARNVNQAWSLVDGGTGLRGLSDEVLYAESIFEL